MRIHAHTYQNLKYLCLNQVKRFFNQIRLTLPFLSVNIPDKTSKRAYSFSLSTISSLSTDNPSSSIGVICKN